MGVIGPFVPENPEKACKGLQVNNELDYFDKWDPCLGLIQSSLKFTDYDTFAPWSRNLNRQEGGFVCFIALVARRPD